MDCNQACENHQDCMTFNIWGKTCELFKAVTELCTPEYVNDNIQCYYKQSWEHPSQTESLCTHAQQNGGIISIVTKCKAILNKDTCDEDTDCLWVPVSCDDALVDAERPKTTELTYNYGSRRQLTWGMVDYFKNSKSNVCKSTKCTLKEKGC